MTRIETPRSTARRSIDRVRWPWLVLGVVFAAALAFGTVDDTGPSTPGERARSLGETIKCPRCAGQSVADSDAPAARAIRTEISDRIAAGESDDEIRAYFASRYGDDILLTPPSSGIGGLVWFLPVAGFVVAAGGLVAVLRRHRAVATDRASVDDEALVARALAEHDRAGPTS